MARGDALDIVLEKIDDKKYWEALKDVCQCNNLDINDYTHHGLVKFFNVQIRNSYNKFVMILKKDIYSPDYSEILIDLAKRVDVSIPKHTLTFYDVCRIEEEIVAAILRKIRAVIIEDNGYAVWDRIEKKAQENFEKLYKDKKITEAEYMNGINKLNTGILENILNGPTGGFGIYMLAKEVCCFEKKYTTQEIKDIKGNEIGKIARIIVMINMLRNFQEINYKIIDEKEKIIL